MPELLLVFVHGYSVTSFDTYGELPLRLRTEAQARGYDVQVENVFLGRYITFHDTVLLDDVARALEHAIKTQLPKEKRFVCITHSTGGPLVRTWWNFYYQKKPAICPMSHLIMLAPANHGSALAQLGKSKLSRVKNWIDGLEPGQGILNWLELGSAESWALNSDWINSGKTAMESTQVFPFVFAGQSIDRKLYDHINSYTGEDGSDGVVRLASANLNSCYLKLVQTVREDANGKINLLQIADYKEAIEIPMKVITGASHSGDDMGIMRSVKRDASSDIGRELVDGIFECLKVNSTSVFQELKKRFDAETAQNQNMLRLEVSSNAIGKKYYVHDRHCMVIFRLVDDQGNDVNDFDLLLTGENDDPDQLPAGFFTDRQCNLVQRNTLTYYLNYDLMIGSPELRNTAGEVVRPATTGLSRLGILLKARPERGFIRYEACSISGTKELLQKVLRPNATTLVDIVLQRQVDPENFRFEKNKKDFMAELSFKNIEPSNDAVV